MMEVTVPAAPRAVIGDPLRQPVPLHLPGRGLRMYDQPRQPLAALLLFGGLVGSQRAQPGAWPCSTWTVRPAGARSVACCPHPGQSQHSAGNRLPLPVSVCREYWAEPNSSAAPVSEPSQQARLTTQVMS